MSETTFLDLKSKRLAYAETRGKSPGVIFCCGFRSDMSGIKAMALEAFCRKRGQQYLRFDYQGHGQSSGKYEEGTIGAWKQDTLDVFDNLTKGPQILVGSSMGGWISLLVARERPERVAALIGIATAADFTGHLLWDKLTPQQKKKMEKDGVIHVPSCEGEKPYPITKQLIEEGRNHFLLGGPIDVNCPVHLLHGMKDEDVPWEISFSINEKLKTKDVKTTLIENGDHRLSEPDHINRLCRTLERMLQRFD